MKWQENRKIILPKATQQELPLPHNNEHTDEEIAEQANQRIGLMLQVMSCTAQYAQLLEQVAQSNLVTPKTVEAWSYALWAMVNHIMSMSAQLRTLASTLRPSLKITPNKEQITWACNKTEEFCQELTDEFNL